VLETVVYERNLSQGERGETHRMKWRLFSDPEIPGSAGDRAIGSRRGDRQFRFWFFMVIFATFLGPLQGCSTPIRLAAVPKDQEAAAVVDDMTGIRYWQDRDLALLQQDARDSYFREADLYAAAGHKGPLPPANFLAISGGGENGAFGAGLLVGWTAAGTRPEFKLVTGISTGALTAPFAFLGPEYDAQLKEVYTTISAKDVLKKRGKLAAVFNDALTDNAPLRRLIAKYVTTEC
jgi:hypothetical protein